MARESKLQSEVAAFLRRKGVVVLTIQPTAGIPQGFPDLLGLLDGGGWVALEVKASNPYRKDGKAKAGAFQPLQERTVAKLDEMYFSRIVWPEVWPDVKKELLNII